MAPLGSGGVTAAPHGRTGGDPGPEPPLEEAHPDLPLIARSCRDPGTPGVQRHDERQTPSTTLRTSPAVLGCAIAASGSSTSNLSLAWAHSSTAGSQVFHDGPYKTIADVEFATAGWVDWYNQRRLHGSLGMMTPAEFETAYYAALNREPHPV